jgi:hypothetical protein
VSEHARPRRHPRDVWLLAAFAVLLVHVAFLGLVSSRMGLVAVLLWYVAPVALLLSASILLVLALVQSWRTGELPGGRRLAGLAALALVVASFALLRTYPSSHDGRPSRVAFRLPLEGPVTVAWGGPTLAVNYHASMPDQRWAYDLLVTVDGRSLGGDGTRLEDSYAFGLPVLAPADGTVRRVHDAEQDGPIGQWRIRRPTGNHIVLEVAPREYLFIAHLRAGSISVTPGERVRAGQLIGRVGNSGNSTEPHVHLHLQDTQTAYLAEGIPFYFHGYRVEQVARGFRGVTVRGDVVERGMPVGGRERRSRARPGAYLGDIVVRVE